MVDSGGTTDHLCWYLSAFSPSASSALLQLLSDMLLLPAAAGSVRSLTPGVTVTSVDEAEGSIQITIPDRQIWATDATNVQAVFPDADVQSSYNPVDATGNIGAQVFVGGFGTRELHKLQTGCYESACCSCKWHGQHGVLHVTGPGHRGPF
jgi:hypothetical protein